MKNLFSPEKVVEYDIPYGANSFDIMGGWAARARRSGFSQAEINQVRDRCLQSQSYFELVEVIFAHSSTSHLDDE